MAYSNVTPPTLPAYDSETYGFYLLVFNYELNAEDWYMVQLYYSSWRFRYEEGVGVVGSPNTFLCSYSDGTWSDTIEIDGEELALNPGLFGQTYQRIYTNANIFNGDEIWLAENCVTPVEGKKFPIQDFLNGLAMALCGRPIRWPSREPVAYLYNGVRLPKLPVVDGHPFMTIVRREFSDESVPDRYFFAAHEYSHYWERETGISILARTVRYFGSEDGAPAAVVYECLDGTSEWVKTDQTEWQVVTDDSDGKINDPCVWANFKLLKKDGTVYLAASEPVPVYE